MVSTRSSAEKLHSPSLDATESVLSDLDDSANESDAEQEEHVQLHTRRQTRSSTVGKAELKPTNKGEKIVAKRTKKTTKAAARRGKERTRILRAYPDVDESDSESDAGSEWDVKRGDRPSVKRLKSKSKSGRGKKKGHDLSTLLQMPLDIFTEIFSHLTPLDLIRVACANRALKLLLMSKSSVTIWTRTRGDVPAPPPDFSELRWAALLFDGVHCQSCDAKGVLVVDFFIRRRLCNACKKANYVCSQNFPKVFPELDPEVEELVPYTNTGGWAHGNPSKSKFYWTADVLAMSTVLATYKKQVHMRAHGARKALEDFKAERRKSIADALIHAAQCATWAQEKYTRSVFEQGSRLDKRLEEIKTRFVAEGYKECDFQLRLCVQPPSNDNELTDQVWKRIRSKLEVQVRRSRNIRVARERPLAVTQRRNIIKRLYKDFKTSQPPSRWAFMPSERTIVFLREDVSSIIHEDSDRVLSEEDFETVMEKLPADVDKFIELRKQYLLSLIIETETSQNPPTYKDSSLRAKKGKEKETDPFQRLDYACSVFKCFSGKCDPSYGNGSLHISWHEIGAHSCETTFTLYHEDEYNGVQFIPQGHTVVKSLMDLALYNRKDSDARHPIFALCPDTATPMDLDKLDVRLVCQTCRESAGQAVYGYLWREAIDHFLRWGHPAPKWTLLSPEQTEEVKSREDLHLWHAEHQWICNHCVIHVEDADTLPNVIEHIKETHENADPVEGVDYIAQAHEKRTFRKPVLAYPNMRGLWNK